MQEVTVNFGVLVLGVIVYSTGTWYAGRRFGLGGLAASWIAGLVLAAVYVWTGRSVLDTPHPAGWTELWPGLLLWTVGSILATWAIERSLRQNAHRLKADDLVAAVMYFALGVAIVLAFLAVKYGYANLSIEGAG